MKELEVLRNLSPSGRLATHHQNWEKITRDPWILDQILGHKLELVRSPYQRQPPEETHLARDQSQLLANEIKKLEEKGAISPSHQPVPEQGFVSRMFLVPKKGGSWRPIIDLRNLNKFIHKEHFKMEGIHLVENLLQKGDWAVKIDLKDAYFAVPIDQGHRQYLQFQFQGATYHFNCLPFGLSSAPRVFTKLMKPVTAWLRQLGCRLISYIDDNLIMAPLRGRSLSDGATGSSALGGFGFHSKLRQIHLESSPKDGIPGVHNRFQNDGNQYTPTEVNEREGSSEENPSKLRDLGQRVGKIYRNRLLDEGGHSTSTLVLSCPASSKELDLALSSGYRSENRAWPRPEGGTSLVGQVGGTCSDVERLLTLSSKRAPKNSNRCLQNRLGSSVPGRENRRTLDPAGDTVSHQLPGIASSVSSTADFCQEQGEHYNPGSNGQCNRHDLHKQKGGDTFTIPSTTSEGNLAVVHGQEDPIEGGAPAGLTERHCRRGIPNNERPLGLETEPINFQSDQQLPGATRNRSVCLQNVDTTASLLQLATRSPSTGDRCLSPILEGASLCQPSMGPDSTSVIRGTESEGQHRYSDTSLENTGVVSNPPISLSRSPDPCPGTGLYSNPDPPDETSLQGQRGAIGRMAYIRNSCEAGSLSEKATELLMASWRSKSQSTYDSLFRKWERWCHQRKRSPIFGPIGDIANFLAELFQEGYSYSSLNSYRSAIASVHEDIEGVSVGKHPVVTRVLKGAFNTRPPQPRYKSTWPVSQVIHWLDSVRNADPTTTLLDLSIKAVTLCVLTRPCRSAELANLDFNSIKFTPEGAFVSPLKPPKQCHPGKAIKDYFFPIFPDNSNICPVATLQCYCQQSKGGRPNQFLFLTSTKPYRPASSSTIARWIKTALSKAGVDTSIFKAHSVRGASTSAAAEAGISIPEILEAADWSNKSTFERFYYRPRAKPSFGVTILNSASNLQSWYTKRNTPKYNW